MHGRFNQSGNVQERCDPVSCAPRSGASRRVGIRSGHRRELRSSRCERGGVAAVVRGRTDYARRLLGDDCGSRHSAPVCETRARDHPALQAAGISAVGKLILAHREQKAVRIAGCVDSDRNPPCEWPMQPLRVLFHRWPQAHPRVPSNCRAGRLQCTFRQGKSRPDCSTGRSQPPSHTCFDRLDREETIAALQYSMLRALPLPTERTDARTRSHPLRSDHR